MLLSRLCGMCLPMLVACVLLSPVSEVRGAERPHGADLEIHWTLIENAKDGQSHQAKFSITNHSQAALPSSGWTIYFNMLHIATNNPVLEAPATVKFTHLNGDFISLQPTKEFAPLKSEGNYTFEYRAVEPVNKPSWGPSGVYIVFEDAKGKEEKPEVIGKMVIEPFTRPEQINRGDVDQTPIPTPAYLHTQNKKLSALPAEKVGKVTPTPVAYQETGGAVTLTAGWKVRHEAGLESDALYLVRMLKPVFGTELGLEVGTEAEAQRILLHLDEVKVAGAAKERGSEAYTLQGSAEGGVQITGADPDGVFYGIQSLLQLLPPTAFKGGNESVAIPAVKIEDAPRYLYRGQHIDVSHNFHSKESILKLLDKMGFYKLNKFHFQVSDDEGWRIEIPELPELTEISGGRAHTRDHDGILHPTYGAGPFRDPPTFGTGFYTRKDFIEILKHAKELHIDVIPEINLPAHARGALIAMKTREKRLMAEGKPKQALEYRLHDPSDTSKYVSAQGFKDNVVCVVEDSVYHFADTIIRNFEEMFQEAGVPLEVWHFGADEVARGAWTESPLCQKFLAEHPEVHGTAGLKNYFVKRILDVIHAHKLRAACWQEAALDHVLVDGKRQDNPVPEFAGGQLMPYVWNNLFGNEDLSNRFANMGYPVVLCPVTNVYWDLAYNKDPLETGLTWGGFIDARSPFELVPDDIFKSTRVDNMGKKFDRAEMYQKREKLTEKGRKNILGIQGQIWCETIKGPKMLEYYVWPKQIGLAERSWAAQPEWAKISNLAAHDAAVDVAWNEFANRLGQRELPRLDSLFGGTGYRLPPPGAVVKDGKLEASAEYPGLTIRYTTDGSEPTASSTEYTGPVTVSGTVKLSTFDTKGRASRVTTVQ